MRICQACKSKGRGRFTLKEKHCIGESRAILVCPNCNEEYDLLKEVLN